MTKLCPRGKAAAKRKFKVYPSAYANAYASKICAGKIKDPSGVKRKDFRGPKPSGAKVGMAVTAGAQSGIGRLEKSGIKKMMSGGFGIFSKKKKEEKKSIQEENANKKKKRLQELKKEIGAKKGKMMIMIAIGKPKKANTGEFIERPMPRMRRVKSNRPIRYDAEYLKKKQAYDYLSQDGTRKVSSNPPVPKKRKKSLYTRPDYEYMKKQKAYDILTDQNRPQRPSRPIKKSKGGDATIKKVIKGLHKASALHKGQAKSLQTVVKKASKGKIMQVANKLEKASKAHAGQAKTLRSIKVRGGGMALQGMNFKGVY